MISSAARLKRQSPSMSYGHGWIMGENGKRWNPATTSSSEIKAQALPKRGKSWLSKAIPCWSN
ncbi:phage filamentation protein Fil family protein [Pantoea agglomerans]|uniref:phage filamentation protein Fil family protein n=1 Tax=Enterobacter agglomerans TaxID=549 RepID=UPI00289EF1EA|nr:phage filamentation protein Fil family protein [Pantoea agglomerans]WNK39203.1 phage filamentation protein Fil family protein [Pantoea agglomerans]